MQTTTFQYWIVTFITNRGVTLKHFVRTPHSTSEEEIDRRIIEALEMRGIQSPNVRDKVPHEMSAPLEEEIAYQLGVDREEPEPGETPYGRDDAIQWLMQNCDDPGNPAYRFRRELADFGIEIGIYQPMTENQMRSVVTTGKKKYDFARGEFYYHFESWMNLLGRHA
jgi:hypothetical protein